MPGDRLALPVRVGGEKHFLAVSGGLAQTLDNFFLAFNGLIIRREPMLHIDAQFTFGQVTDMTHRGLHLIAGAQILSDGLGFGGRLHNH
ncbi:hypothetical protein SDC9_211010 [bioreactor metagenome]|uniref:Uncharacterized protein n=1 Tax=bioreactor metagenome TaxID=1076179 RepID=A0A645JVJ8_9ZZZZ